MGYILGRNRLEELLKGESPIVKNMIDKSLQIQENGIDLTLGEIYKWKDKGMVTFNNTKRKISEVEEIKPNNKGYFFLNQGSYKISYNEIINLPLNIIGISKSRSSLLRCGCMIISAVWDAGFSGRGEGLLVITNPYGLKLQKNARLVQLIFLELENPVKHGYKGIFGA
jgi:dUTP pyrophosphatase